MKRLIIALFGIFALQLNAQQISPYLVGTNWWYQIESKKHIRDTVATGHMKSMRIGGNQYNRSMPDNSRMKGWVQMVRDMGMEPIVQVSAFGNSPAEAAASIVRYFNVNSEANGVEPVQVWSIGNEPALHNDFSVAEVSDQLIEIATAMKEQDPDILIFAPDMAWLNKAYLDPLIGGSEDVAGASLPDGTFLIDGFTWHFYPMKSNYTRSDMKSIVESKYKSEVAYITDRMEAANATYGRTGENQLKWGIGEFNINVTMSNYGDQYTTVEGLGTHSFLNGQYFAEFFSLSMEYGAYFTTSWSIHESSGDRDEGDLGMFDGNTIETIRPRSNYHHSDLVGEYIYGEYMTIEDNKGNNIEAFGGKHPDGSFSIIVLNKDEATAYDFALSFDGSTPGGPSLIMTADIGLSQVFEGYVPPQSTMVFDFDAAGQLQKKVFYSVDHARDFKRPSVLLPGEEEVHVSVSSDDSRACIDQPFTVAAHLISTSADYTLQWDFGADASPSQSDKAGEVTVIYSTSGEKTATLTVFRDGVAQEELSKTIQIDVSTCEQGPYNGTAQTVPGIVEAVYYDEGGQDIAYWDQEEENQGPGIRQGEGVDTDNGDVNGNVGYIRDGEWIEYTLRVEKTMTYDLLFNYASQSGGGSFKLLFDGINKTGNIEVPATGDWGRFETLVIRGINLEARDKVVMRFEVVQPGFNMGRMEFLEEGQILNTRAVQPVTIYPNPVGDRLNIGSAPAAEVAYFIYTLSGKPVKQGTLSDDASIGVVNLKGGTYVLKLKYGHDQTQQLFIKK